MNDLETAIQEILDSISRGEVTKQTDWDIIMETLQASTDAERINNIQQYILKNFSFRISNGAANLLKTLIVNEKIFSSSTKSIDEIVSLCGDSIPLESRSTLEALSENGNKFLYQFLSENFDEILSAVRKETFNVGRYTLSIGKPVAKTLADGTKDIIKQTDMVTAADAEKAGYTAVESTNGTVYTKEKDGFVRIFKPDTVEDGIGTVLILASTALVANEVYNDCQQENYKDASKELMSYSGSLLGSTIIAEEWRGTAVLLVSEAFWFISLSLSLRGLRGA